MISNNYVPEWHISPFEHLKYTLVRNQDLFSMFKESEVPNVLD